MIKERTYYVFPCTGNSPEANQLNFLAWQIKVGDEISLGVIRRDEGSHLCAANAEPLIRLTPREDLHIEWLGDAIIGCDASGNTHLRAIAVGGRLLIEMRRNDNWLPAAPMGGDWRLSWENTPGTDSLIVRVEPADREAAALPAEGPDPLSDLDRALARSEKWIGKTPSVTGYPEFEEAWNHTWLLHRIATFPPIARFSYPWETPGRGYLFHYFGHWDAVHNVLDMLWLDADHCVSIVRNLLRLQDPDDGHFGVTFSPRTSVFSHPLAKQSESATSPPLWNYAALEVFRRTADMGFLAECYKAFRRNVIWFETRRQFQRNGLFWHSNLGETGYDNMPRGDSLDAAQMPAFSDFAAVDLCSQMVKYYRDLADMAGLLGERGEAADHRRKADTLAKTIRTTLWDEDAGFFFDADMRTGELARVKTMAGFWPMISGVADEAQVARLVEHLTNPAEFWTRYPVPSVSRDEASFCLDCWRGPVWASQNLWIILGLQDYGYYDVAASIAHATMCMVASGLRSTGYVYEFYNPNDTDIEALSRKRNPLGPCNYYIGHNPVHAIFLAGLYGMRSRETGLEICPQWKHIPRESGVQFAFGRAKLELYTSSAGEASWQLLSDGKEVLRGSEGTPAIVEYASLRPLTREMGAARKGPPNSSAVASEAHPGSTERMDL